MRFPSNLRFAPALALLPMTALAQSGPGIAHEEASFHLSFIGAPQVHFGSSVSLAGDFLAIGAPGSGPDGTLNGSMELLQLTNGAWQPVLSELGGLGPIAGLVAGFGTTVATDGHDLLVGGHFGGAVSATQLPAGGGLLSLGSFSSSDPTVGVSFGRAIAVGNSRAVISAPNQARAFLFEKAGMAWTQQAELIQSTPQPSDGFGWAVALDGDLAVVSAPGFNGEGRVYGYGRIGDGSWHEVWDLDPAEIQAGSSFGLSLALADSRLYVGAPHQDVDGVNNAGAVFVYDVTPGQDPVPLDLVTARTPSALDNLGASIGVHGKRLLVGAPASLGFGSARLFERGSAGSWNEVAHYKPSPTSGGVSPGAKFGSAVALGSNGAFVGAPGATGIESSGLPVQESGLVFELGTGELLRGEHGIGLLSGGTQELLIRSGEDHADQVYALIGSLTGPGQGTNVAGVHLPLQIDSYTTWLLGDPLGIGTIGVLDQDGFADISYTIPGGIAPGLVGLLATHAVVTIDETSGAITGVSNPVELELLP